MPDISHQTKITIGLMITILSFVFFAGYSFKAQEAIAERVATLEDWRDQTTQVSQDVAVIKAQLNNVDTKLNEAILRWDKHIDAR